MGKLRLQKFKWLPLDYRWGPGACLNAHSRPVDRFPYGLPRLCPPNPLLFGARPHAKHQGLKLNKSQILLEHLARGATRPILPREAEAKMGLSSEALPGPRLEARSQRMCSKAMELTAGTAYRKEVCSPPRALRWEHCGEG